MVRPPCCLDPPGSGDLCPSGRSLKPHATPTPRPKAPMLSVDNMGPAAAVTTLRTALEGLDTLSAQRASLEEGLKVCACATRAVGWAGRSLD